MQLSNVKPFFIEKIGNILSSFSLVEAPFFHCMYTLSLYHEMLFANISNTSSLWI